jgi:hypothetical protein
MGCTKNVISTTCPPIVIYTIEEQIELDKIRTQVNNLTLDKFLIDYYNLRENLKICY